MKCLLILTPDQTMTILLWIIGGFCTVAILLLTHIGNAGSTIKKDITKHATEIAGMKSDINHINQSQARMESKIDKLIEK